MIMGETFNIIGIDPGNNLGVSIVELSTNTLEIVSIQTIVYSLDVYVCDRVIDRLTKRLFVLNNIIYNLLQQYQPVAFSIETAFLNTRFPRAVMQLSMYVATIYNTINTYDNIIKIFKYPPKLIKSSVGAGGNADKDKMLSNILTIRELTKYIDFTLVSEHEVDATAIAYTAILEFRKYQHLLYMLPAYSR